MEFTLPTTKEEMYEVLGELFYHYKVRREPYEEVELLELQLERQTFVPKTEAELTLMAQTELEAKHLKEILDYQTDLEQKITALSVKVDQLTAEESKGKIDIDVRYAQSLLKLEQTIQKNGLGGSGVALSQIAWLENEKNKEISQLESRISIQKNDYFSQISSLQQRLVNADTYFSEIHQKEIEKKAKELADEQDKLEREIFKYNNGLTEKELRYSNTLSQIRANMQARYLEMKVVDYSKDQLVEMGYYADVIRCITHYYDSLDSVMAYEDLIESERKLVIYLDEFYPDLLYMYKLRAYP